MSAGWQVVPDQREQVPRQFNFVERSRVKAFMAEVHKRRNRTPWLAVKTRKGTFDGTDHGLPTPHQARQCFPLTEQSESADPSSATSAPTCTVGAGNPRHSIEGADSYE
jgi:hypothetical protein